MNIYYTDVCTVWQVRTNILTGTLIHTLLGIKPTLQILYKWYICKRRCLRVIDALECLYTILIIVLTDNCTLIYASRALVPTLPWQDVYTAHVVLMVAQVCMCAHV